MGDGNFGFGGGAMPKRTLGHATRLDALCGENVWRIGRDTRLDALRGGVALHGAPPVSNAWGGQLSLSIAGLDVRVLPSRLEIVFDLEQVEHLADDKVDDLIDGLGQQIKAGVGRRDDRTRKRQRAHRFDID